MSDRKAMTIEIAMHNYLRDGLGRPLILRQAVCCGACGWQAQLAASPAGCPQCGSVEIRGGDELPIDQQPTIGRNLLERLARFHPEKPEHSFWVVGIVQRISEAIEQREAYVAGETAVNILREAWRQTALLKPEEGGFTPFVDGQIGALLLIEPPTSDLSMLGITEQAAKAEPAGAGVQTDEEADK